MITITFKIKAIDYDCNYYSKQLITITDYFSVKHDEFWKVGKMQDFFYII